jgi:hypothetical protein
MIHAVPARTWVPEGRFSHKIHQNEDPHAIDHPATLDVPANWRAGSPTCYAPERHRLGTAATPAL